MKNRFSIKLFKFFSIPQFTIRQRLTFFICSLLFSVIITFSFISYYAIKKASLREGKARLETVTSELGSMLGQSTTIMLNRAKQLANNDSIKKCLQSQGRQFRAEALEKMQKLQVDSTYIFVNLLDRNFVSVLHTVKKRKSFDLNLKALLSPLPAGDTLNKVGKLYLLNDSVYYPIIVSITVQKQVIGYIVSWRTLTSTPQKVKELSLLLGTGAVIYLANEDGSLWSNMIKSIAPPPVAALNTGKVFTYKDKQGRTMAATKPIANSSWLVWVGFPEEVVLKAAQAFFQSVLILGSILILAGVCIAQLIGRNIIRPLRLLNKAANAIAAGDYSATLKLNRRDELGKLAYTFNSMAREIQQMQASLEKKVLERTCELEIVNKELESFSYSVSHDLKAPLRAISGYTQIIMDEYGADAPQELNRLYKMIRDNSKQMAVLIDDLLAFSRLGRKAIEKRSICITDICKNVLEELKVGSTQTRLILLDLPDAIGDYAMLKQVFINLISNALKYTSGKEQPEIEIGSENGKHENIYYVKDNGVGFDMQYRQKLFGVFQRLHNQNEFEGNGVGLALVEKVVTKHGGRVWAEAELNKGAVFYFSLPK